MNVEYVQENANAVAGGFVCDGYHFAVGWRNGDRACWNRAIGIAEKIKTEGCQDEKRQAPPRACEVSNDRAGRGQSQRVIDTI
jgi:hypothetical protein